MKYIITERQYHLLKEEEKVIHFPSIDYFGGWYEMQSYLDKKGNPLYSIDGNLKLIKTPIESLGNLTSVGGDLYLKDILAFKKYSIKEIEKMVNVKGKIYI